MPEFSASYQNANGSFYGFGRDLDSIPNCSGCLNIESQHGLIKPSLLNVTIDLFF